MSDYKGEINSSVQITFDDPEKYDGPIIKGFLFQVSLTHTHKHTHTHTHTTPYKFAHNIFHLPCNIFIECVVVVAELQVETSLLNLFLLLLLLSYKLKHLY